MVNKKAIKKHREPPFHVVKRDDMPWWGAWGIRVATIIAAFLLVGLLSMALSGRSLFETYGIMFSGVFGRIFEGRTMMLWKYLQEIAILLALALALTPAFKMKFWNCGAEGQALMGGLASIICMIELGPKLPYPVLIIVIAVTSIVAGAIWGVIPAIFKAVFNTNETLFTLMMNYIATQIIAYYVYIKGGGSNVINPVEYGNFPAVGSNDYFVNIILVAVITIVMFVYLKYSKQGYEISVVGESQNTARYIGINVKKVIVRTMVISGALCGVTGMLLVAGKDHSINVNSVGGQGFTAILMSWLGQFNPFIMAVMTALVVFLRIGVAKVADTALLNSSFSEIMVGVVILMLVGCEFFINYSFKFKHNKKEAKV
ncbi:MAG: ABC transporter permease [Clostridia bacterium]|nr:ABC transporter permease [Clostridia bacterium]